MCGIECAPTGSERVVGTYIPSDRDAVRQAPDVIERKILVVDDEPDLLIELADALAIDGWEVDTAGDAAAAWDKLNADPGITVLLTDIRMPGMDGLGLARRVCESRGDVTATEVVLLTGHGTVDDAASAVRVGAFDFLSKPVSIAALFEAADRAHRSAAERRLLENERLAELETLRADRKRLQEKLAEHGVLNRLGESLPRELGNILSHELRTPLAVLTAVPELLSRKADLPASEIAENLTIVRSAGTRLAAIADDFVELLTARDPNYCEIQEHPPQVILRRVESVVAPEAEAAKKHIVVRDVADGSVETDLRHLVKLIERLVSNALAWSPEGGEVVLSATDEGPDDVKFAVSDNGPGMTEADIEIAKKPFRQLDMSLARRVGGLGLGLSLADRTAALLGGRLSVVSAPGKGTIAAVILPRCYKRPPAS